MKQGYHKVLRCMICFLLFFNHAVSKSQYSNKKELFEYLRNEANGLYSEYQMDNLDVRVVYWPRILFNDSLVIKTDEIFSFLIDIDMNKLAKNNSYLLEVYRKFFLTDYTEIFNLSSDKKESKAFSITYNPNYGLDRYDNLLVSFKLTPFSTSDSVKLLIYADNIHSQSIELPFSLDNILKMETELSKIFPYEN